MKATHSKSKTKTFQQVRAAEWNRAKLLGLLRGARKRILVIGDVGVDRYTFGQVERISPEAPVPIVLVQEERHKLGLAANVADNVRALGGEALLVGVVGADRHAQDFRSLLRESRISPRFLLADGSRRTVLKERVVSDRQQLLRVDYETPHPLPRTVEKKLLAQVARLVPRCDAVVLEDYCKGLVTPRLASEIFALARKHGKVVAVDPNAKSPLRLYRGAWVLTPNTKEAETLSGITIQDPKSLLAAGRKILAETGAEHVVITRGKEGMALFSRGSSAVRLIPTYAREVYDVSGAGDTVISVLAMAVAGGGSIEEAAILGNLAAGVEVGKRGTATVSIDEIESVLDFFIRRG